MATVKILYFGSIRDITGCSTDTVTDCSTIGEILEQIIKRYPAIEGIRYQISLNRQLLPHPAPQTSNLKPQTPNPKPDTRYPIPADGDEIALLPPFAGG
ncbi:MAG: hypothetical protein A2X22_06385 [Bacteroidetes bacterium GWF2_49_14]|nr:MAG: hypothetical protein A2X22_06385 [Bacteroidetes bacterium GWF2_49_14]HBB90919.1 hypothetical protein [Bacteroidales bacterium]